MSDVLKEVTGILDRRFLLNIFFPSLVFWLLLLIIAIVAQGSIEQAIAIWESQSALMKIVQCISLVTWVTFFANVLSSQLQYILRIFEGYWASALGRWLASIGKRWHQEQLQIMFDRDDLNQDKQLYTDYPTRLDEIMPTRLGNILKSAELYPRIRYGMDAVLLWPRLYNVCPERFLQVFASSRAALDFMLVLATLSLAFAITSGMYLFAVGASWWFFLVCFWGGCLVAWLAYRGALSSATLYAEQIRVAFDLYRDECRQQLRLPEPATLQQERELWSTVGQFIYRNVRPQIEGALSVADSQQHNP